MKRQIKLILTLLCVMVLSFQLQIATLAAEPAETTVAVNTETAELPTNITKEAAAEIKDGEDPVKGIAVTEVWYKLTTGSKAYYTVELENSCKVPATVNIFDADGTEVFKFDVKADASDSEQKLLKADKDYFVKVTFGANADGEYNISVSSTSVITKINNDINGFIWNNGVWLLLFVGLLTTVITGVFQITHIGHWFSQTIGKIFKKDVSGHVKGKSISQFQALCTALAATIGVGNIAGVATAIVTGGPGAVFWMWIAAFLGMMTNYSENVLGIYFRRKNADGEWSGGPMYYLEEGLGKMKYGKPFGKPLAILFCIFAILASFGIGAMGQINKIVVNMVSAFEIKPLTSVELYNGVTLYHLIIGIVLTAIAALILLGGLKRIANFAEKIVPFMVVLFVIGSIAIIGINHAQIGAAFSAIFKYAFTVPAALGGVAGSLIKTVVTTGCKRGVFSNEAGLGSSVMVHSNSNVVEPVRQGLWGIFEVFADTMIVCTMTALVVLTSIPLQNFGVEGGVEGINDATLVASAFGDHFGAIGEGFVAIAILLFAFTTALGWDHYGSKAWEYMFGVKSIKIYRVIHLVTILLGALLTSSLAWDISDTFNGLMMLPNLIGVIACSGLVVKITKNYKDRKFKKKDIEPMISAVPEVQAEQVKLLKQNKEL